MKEDMKNKILSIVLIILVAIFAMSTAVNALSFTATMSTESTTVPESTEFTIKIKVSNLDVGANGINSLSGYLKYDTDVFETISESSIDGLNSWNKKYDNTTGKIDLTKIQFVTSTQEVVSITFKTKAGVTGKKGNISFSEIVASNSAEDIEATNISTTITVGTPGSTDTNTTNTTNTSNSVLLVGNTSNRVTIANNTVNNTTNNAVNNTANNRVVANNSVSSYVNTMTNTSSQTDMPYTGVNDTIVFLMLVLVAIAIVFYIKIEKLNKDIR